MGVRILAMITVLAFLAVGTDKIEAGSKIPPFEEVPLEYAQMHMPKGWWTDPAIVEEGRAIYQGKKYGRNVSKKKRINCAKCHGVDGTPVVKLTPNLWDENLINRRSDSYMFWKVSEGVPETKMRDWKRKLSEEEIWRVIAYFHTFSHGRKAEVHDHPELEK